MRRKTICLLALIFTLLLSLDAYAQPQGGILYYSRTDGSVPAISVDTGQEVTLIPPSAFVGANPGASRNIAFDPETRVMWYSATDGHIHSVNVDTLEAGPDIFVIDADIGAARHLFIDYARRKIITPLTSGAIQMYNLSDQAESGLIPADFFTDGNVGGFRHFASDSRTGALWYAATDGSFREMDPDALVETGRQIPFSVQIGANPGALRHFVVDPVRDLLLYVVTDGSIASINLTTLEADPFAISSDAFSGADPGAGRPITYDPPVPVIPDILGTYVGSGTETTMNCQDPADNGTFPVSGSFSISDQVGGTFIGSATLMPPIGNVTTDVSFSGTVTANGQLTGTFTYVTMVDGVFDSSGDGTFTGQVTGNTLTLNFSGQDQVGDTCTSTGSFSGSR